MKRRRRWIVPAAAPEWVASTSTTASTPSHCSSSAQRLSLVLAHGDSRGVRARAQAPYDLQSRGVVVAQPIAHPDHNNRGRACACAGDERAGLTSATLDGEREEVGRAGDAGIVIADRLLAAQRELLVGEIEFAFDDRPQVLLDHELVLRCGRHDPGIEDGAVLIDLVAMVDAGRAGPRWLRARPRAAG